MTNKSLQEVLEKHIGIDEKTKSLIISINDIDAEVAFHYNNKLEVKALLNGIVKEISELLVECSDVESISKNETFLEGYATAKDEIKANLLEALQ